MTGTSRTVATQRLDTLMKSEADRVSRVERPWRVPVTIAASVLVAFLVGMAASAVSGWFAVHWMLQFLSRRGLRGLAVYRILVGLSLLLLLAYR